MKEDVKLHILIGRTVLTWCPRHLYRLQVCYYETAAASIPGSVHLATSDWPGRFNTASCCSGAHTRILLMWRPVGLAHTILVTSRPGVPLALRAVVPLPRLAGENKFRD